MFQREVWSPSAPDKLYAVDDFIDGDFCTKKGCVDNVQCACAFMVTILHIGTFVKFNFDPSLM